MFSTSAPTSIMNAEIAEITILTLLPGAGGIVFAPKYLTHGPIIELISILENRIIKSTIAKKKNKQKTKMVKV